MSLSRHEIELAFMLSMYCSKNSAGKTYRGFFSKKFLCF